jgi:hypothetical protein
LTKQEGIKSHPFLKSKKKVLLHISYWALFWEYVAMI